MVSVSEFYKKSINHRIRDFVAYCGEKSAPITKYLFPNFIAVHYFYIISFTFIGSILIYPANNIKYIDALFTAAGAATQGGLNTVNVMDFDLYQQIVIYIMCTMCTPIAIHGTLAFVRLYWFERYFDGIRDSSKRNFKMRRTKTILERQLTQRTMTRDPSHTNSTVPQRNSHIDRRIDDGEDFREKLFSGKVVCRDEHPSLNDHDNGSFINGNYKNETDSKDSSWGSSNTVEDEKNQNSQHHVAEVVKFNEPAPKKAKLATERFVGRRGSKDITPADMFRSIAMLQDMHNDSEEDSGPPLVIKSPMEEKVQSRKKDIKKTEVLPKNNRSKNIDNSNHDIESRSTEGNSSLDHKDLSVHHVQSNNISGTSSVTDSLSDQDLNDLSVHFVPCERPRKYNKTKKEKGYRTNAAHTFMYRPRRTFNRNLKKQRQNSKVFRQKLKRKLSFKNTDADDKYKDSTNPDLGSEKLNFAEIHSCKNISSDELEKLAHSPEFQKKIYDDWRETNKKVKPSLLHPQTENSYLTKAPLIRHSTLFQNLQKKKGKKDQQDNVFDQNDAVPQANANTESYAEVYSQSGSNGNFPIDEEGLHHRLQYDADGISIFPRNPLTRTMSTNYLSWEPIVGRNSVFIGLTSSQKDELGGVEYRALKLLCLLLIVYYVGFTIISFTLLVPWICVNDHYREIVKAEYISPAWWGFFTAMSAFADLGLTLTPDSMNSFNEAVYPLIVMMYFIVIGNTGFPVMLRFMVWVLFKCSPDLSQTKESLGFLLDHPRRCFTLLFPSGATWWLFATLVGLNATDLILFIILDFGSAVLASLSKGLRVLDGLFQAISTRTAGFSIVDISQLHPSIQVSYMIMMYISVLPLAISIRRTNVYEEQSLGIYDTLEQDEEDEDLAHARSSVKSKIQKKKKSLIPRSFIGAHLRRQLSFDIWFIFLGLFIICLCESGKIQNPNDAGLNVFSILFEIVSAYGTVGLSMGYPGTNQSLSRQFTTISKLVIIIMLIRGRHRGLPYAVDRAIILPSDRLENIDHIEDLKLTRQVNKDAKGDASGGDPLNGVLKSKYNFLKKKVRWLLRRPETTSRSSSGTELRDLTSTTRSGSVARYEGPTTPDDPLFEENQEEEGTDNNNNSNDTASLNQNPVDHETPITFKIPSYNK